MSYHQCVTIRPLFAFIVAAGLFLLVITGCSSNDGNDVLVVPDSTIPAPAVTVVVQPPESTPSATRQVLFSSGAPPATEECPTGLLDSNSSVSTVGLDEVLFGMTVNAASTAAGVCLIADGEANADCHYVQPAGGPDGVGFMVTNGTIERVDIIAGTIATRSGAGIGKTEQQILDLFPGKIETTASPFGDGNQLAFIPSDADDQQFRVIWETDTDGVVTQFRSGRRPQVERINGCQ